jgi:hypothetical protein
MLAIIILKICIKKVSLLFRFSFVFHLFFALVRMIKIINHRKEDENLSCHVLQE